MSFKRRYSILTLGALVALSGFATACRFAQRPPVSVVNYQLSNRSGDCMNDAGNSVARFFEGQDDSRQFELTMTCVLSSVDMISTRVEGERAGVYSRKEIQGFLSTYVMKGVAIPDAMMDEIFNLKVALIGGSDREITRTEIQTVRDLLAKIRDKADTLRPLLPLSAEGIKGRSPEQLEKDILAFQEFARELAQVIQTMTRPYEFARFDALLAGYAQLAKQDAPLTQLVRSKIPLMQSAKEVLIDRDGNAIRPENWAFVITQGARIYSQLLRMTHITTTEKDLFSGAGNRRLGVVVLEMIDILRDSVYQHPGQTIAFAEMDRLFDRVEGALPLSTPVLKGAVRTLFQRVFGSKTNEGITPDVVARIRQTAEIWLEGQRYIDAAFDYLRSPTATQSELLGPTAEAVLGMKSGETIKRDSSTDLGVRYVRSMIESKREITLFGDNSGEMDFSPKVTSIYTHVDLTQKLWSHLLAEKLMGGYSDDPVGGSIDEFRAFYKDFAPPLIEIKLLPTVTNWAESKNSADDQFLQANIFTWAGNGDLKLERDEIAQHLALQMSAKFAALRMHKLIAGISDDTSSTIRGRRPLKKICKNETDNPRWASESWGLPVFSRSCFIETFFTKVDELWARMPGLLNYYRGLSAEDAAEFRTLFARVAFADPGIHDDIPAAFSQNFMMIGHYIELLVLKFDQSKDGIINYQEGKEGYHVLDDYMRKSMVKGQMVEEAKKRLFEDARKSNPHLTEQQMTYKIEEIETLISDAELERRKAGLNGTILKDGFLYLLAKGKTPGLVDMIGWWLTRWRWNSAISADRLQLLRVLSAVSAPQKKK